MKLLRGFILGFALAAMSFSPAQATTQSTDQIAEAAVFFDQVLQETKNPLIANLARENLLRLQEGKGVAMRKVEVPLMSQNSNSLAVPVLINKATMATFIVDTGATYTVITPKLAQKLNVQIKPDTQRMTIMTANGLVNAPVVVIPAVSIGGVEVRNVKAIVQDLGSETLLSGLLGMNFFKDIELTIKPNKLVLGVNQPVTQ